jgi:hypothetical protein
MCSIISPMKALWIWRAHRKYHHLSQSRRRLLQKKVKPKTTFERFALTDDEIGKTYSIFERFSGPESFFPDEAEYFPNSYEFFRKIFTQNSVSVLIYKILHCRFCLNFSPQFRPQSTHRVAFADFWRTSHHDGKISPGLRG